MKKIISLLFATVISVFVLSPVYLSADAALTSYAAPEHETVADYADLFTDGQEAEMREKIAALRSLYHHDLIIITDTSTGELESDEYCESFLESSGAGAGFDGSILFICMDPNDRYWVNEAYGGFANRFTDAMMNYIDQPLDIYLNQGLRNGNANGEFGTAALQYIDAFTEIYENGGKVPRRPVADYADIFTAEQEAKMREKIAEIRERYGYDLAIVTDVTSFGLSHKDYCEEYWFDNGFGLGDDNTGSVLFICMEAGNRGWWSAAFGGLRDIFTERFINYVDDRLEPYMIAGRDNGNYNGEYGRGVLDYLDNLAEIYENGGKVPREPLELKYPAVIAAIAGLIAGGASVSKQKRRMKTVEKAGRAKGYMREGSFQRRELGDVLVGVSVTKTARSSSSSSGGRSSYSSSGRSSGGGRSF